MENRNFKILAIDDNQDNLILLKALVKDNFPEALWVMALSGEKGLELAAQEDPDVILLDIIMPVMDGFEVCSKLKADNILKEIPVVFLTALKGDKQSRIKALECGAEAFLSKPIDESELIAQIRAMVKIRGSYEQKRNEKKRLARLVEEQTAELKAAHLSSLRLLEDLKREIEERKKVERELITAKEQAETANVAKSQFLSNMSHEIRTPMNGVLGFLQLLEYSPINREQQEYINNIKISTQVLLNVIADILDISKIEAGKMTIEKITIDLEFEMENSVIPFTAKAKEKGLDINLLIRPEVPQVMIGDSLRLKQIIGNLVSNAVKFTEQGEIFIEVSLLDETENEAEVNFSIKDTGIGMTEQEVQNIFNPFSQADMSHTRKYGGTGLGLTISKRLIEMMGGHISLISKKERGTIVNFCLWLTKPDKTNRPEKLDYPVLRRKQILIIDNHKASRDTAKIYLEAAECLVHESERVMDALDKLQNVSKHYDVVIIDEKILQTAKKTQIESIREKTTQGKIPLILFSSAASDFQTKHNRGDLFSRNISKPYRRSSLINSIAEVLQGKNNKGDGELSCSLQRTTKLGLKSNFKILLVEDNDVNIKYFINLLKQEDLECEVAVNGLEALKIMENQEFDIIFMDCQMPVMDGYETTEKIRKTEGRKKHTTIIAMTAYAMAGDKEKCLKVGMDDYMSKPFTHQKLFDMLQKYI